MSLARRCFWLPLIVALTLVSVDVSAAAAASSAETARVHTTGSSSRTTKRFWTEQRMQEAEDNDLDSEGSPDPDDGGLDPSTDTAPTTTIDPEAPTSGTNGSSPPTLRTQRSDIPFTSEDLGGETDYPYITHGRVFFRSGGVSYSCSGTVVTSSNESVVWTAGHCVNHVGQGGWVNKWVFVPGYDDGEAPYGKWTAETLAAPRGWIGHGSAAYDMGAAIVGPNSEGETISDVVGSQGIAWNLPRRHEYTAYGYPAAGSFDGGSLWACHSRYGWSDPIPGPNPMAIGCNLSYGSSGGGWIVDLADGSYLNSVTSYSHVGERRVTYGPYFGDAAANLYRLVEG